MFSSCREAHLADEPKTKQPADALTVRVEAASKGALRISITLEGEAPGLSEHRLSIEAFSKPLQKLLTALRRIASGLARQALGDPSYGKAGGDYAKQAKGIDLQLEAIRGNSPLALDFVCRGPSRPVDAQLPLFELFQNGLLTRAAEELLSAIDAEARGDIQNAAVKNYLRSLPSGIQRQKYTVQAGDRVKTVEVGDVTLSELPVGAPFLDEFSGTLVGLGFEPGPTEFRLRMESGFIRVCAATPEQVDEAIVYRSQQVRVMVARSHGTERLLWFRPVEAARRRVPLDEAADYLMTTWDGLLKRLAQ